MEKRMDWFVEKYNNGMLDYSIYKTGKSYGTVCMPTGTGKSGVAYEDIIKTIERYLERNNGKLVINVSCPILKLVQQFMNDLFEVISIIYADKSEMFGFYMNSSDNGREYDVEDMEMDVDSFKHFSRFVRGEKRIAFVASCHKSLQKYIREIKKWQNNGIEFVSYLDECHLFDVHELNDDEKSLISEMSEDKDISGADLKMLKMRSSKVIGLSATPDREITETIDEDGENKWIIHTYPADAIRDNIIVAPYVKYRTSNVDHITVKQCIDVMNDAKRENPNIWHKVLVTLKSADDLKEMQKELEKVGKKVFSTCSKYGMNLKGEGDDVVGFIRDIDEYEGDCFVLHIRQLIQGIDIKSLTDCIIYTADHGSTRHYRHIIQTIGRILRPLKGERGMKNEDRKKKVGRVYFITPENNDEVKKGLEYFIIKYYGLDMVEFEPRVYSDGKAASESEIFDCMKGLTINTKDEGYIDTLLVNIEKFVKTKLVSFYKLENRIGNDFDIEKYARETVNRYDMYSKDMDSAELLDNRGLIDKTKEIFKANGITAKALW